LKYRASWKELTLQSRERVGIRLPAACGNSRRCVGAASIHGTSLGSPTLGPTAGPLSKSS